MKKLFSFLMAFAMCSQAFAITEWDKTVPLASDKWIDFPVDQQSNNSALDGLLSKYQRGMKLSFASASTIYVSSGEVSCSDATDATHRFRKTTSTTTVGWADLDTGGEASNTTYYVYAVGDADSLTPSFKISASSSAPVGYTYFLRLGSFVNNSSSDITATFIVNDNVSFDVTNYDSGWFSVTSGSNYTKTHGLGTTNMIIRVYMSTDSGGANPWIQEGIYNTDNGSKGTSVTDITTTSLTLRTSSDYAGFYLPGSSDNITNVFSGYMRVVAFSLE